MPLKLRPTGLGSQKSWDRLEGVSDAGKVA
jgi:hypothetical protein